jgi:hypothetical protein
LRSAIALSFARRIGGRANALTEKRLCQQLFRYAAAACSAQSRHRCERWALLPALRSVRRIDPVLRLTPESRPIDGAL